MTYIAKPDEILWKFSGQLWGNDPQPVGIFPDGSLLIARGDRYEWRVVHEPDGSIYQEYRMPGSDAAPYRELRLRAPWEDRRSWWTGKHWQERSWSIGSFNYIQRRAHEGAEITETKVCNESM